MLKDISEQVGFPKAKTKDTESIICGTRLSSSLRDISCDKVHLS